MTDEVLKQFRSATKFRPPPQLQIGTDLNKNVHLRINDLVVVLSPRSAGDAGVALLRAAGVKVDAIHRPVLELPGSKLED